MTVAAKPIGLARRWLRLFMRSVSASAAAEMALIFPFFGYIGINVVDFGMYTFAKMETDLAAQAAVSEARNLCNTSALLPATTNCATLTANMLAAAQSTSLGAAVTLNAPTEGYYCANTAGTLILINPQNQSTCSGTVPGSISAPGDYIYVQASYTYVSLFPSATIVTSIPHLLPSPITRTAWMRLS